MLSALAEGRSAFLGFPNPSSYSEGRSLCNGVLAFPQVVVFMLLQLPSMDRYTVVLSQFEGGTGHVLAILLPLTENVGRAKVPWSADSWNLTASCLEVSRAMKAFLASSEETRLVPLNRLALKADVPRLKSHEAKLKVLWNEGV